MSQRDYEFSEIASVYESVAGTTRKRPQITRNKRLRQACDSLFDFNKTFVSVRAGDPVENEYTFVDLFSGAGGLSQGFRQAGFRKLFSVEIDRDASATLRRNFPESRHFEGRIEDVQEAELQDLKRVAGVINVVCGGPPCQGFSIAGARDPKDPRNFLFKQFVRIAATLEPEYIVLENVPGILTMKGGAVAEAIRDAFGSVGYPGMSVALLESASYGVPQLRPRAIFIANRLSLANPYPRSPLDESQFVPIEAAIMDLADEKPDSSMNHEWTRHSKQVEARIANVPPGGSLYSSYYDAFKRQYPGKPSMTVKENHGGTHIHPHRNRVLSAREMARLQTFPDAFIFEGTMKRAMWQIGNAVPPLLAEYVARALSTELDRSKNPRRIATRLAR